MKALKYFFTYCILATSFMAFGQKNEGTPLLEFVLMDSHNKDTLFYAEHVVVYYSPDSSFASIKHQSKYRLVFRMPYHQLRTDHLEAIWDIRGKGLYFHSNDTHDRFYATDPKKLELEFSSSEGHIDLKTKKFTMKDVPGILTGNALVIPEDHTIVFESSQIPVLHRAQLILNSFSRHHHLVSNEIKIGSRKEYEHGKQLFYDYYHAPTRKTYRFNHVSLHTSKHVEALQIKFTTTITLSIHEEDLFELFEGKYFKGEAIANDSNADFFFKGQIGILEDGKISWSSYEGSSFLGKF